MRETEKGGRGGVKEEAKERKRIEGESGGLSMLLLQAPLELNLNHYVKYKSTFKKL